MKLYHLWNHDDYTSEEGQTEQPILKGTFANVAIANEWKEKYWHVLDGDFRGQDLLGDGTKLEAVMKYDYKHPAYLWLEEDELIEEVE